MVMLAMVSILSVRTPSKNCRREARKSSAEAPKKSKRAAQKEGVEGTEPSHSRSPQACACSLFLDKELR